MINQQVLCPLHQQSTSMTREQLTAQIQAKGTFLCVGLDPDPARFPEHMHGDPGSTVAFCRAIVHATSAYAVAYKLNIAFFEALGRKGWDILFAVRELLPEDAFLIADAKRADIGNSSRMYARAFFEELNFDAITVSPYMGEDSIRPFLDYTDHWTIVLALTSNHGAQDFQLLETVAGPQVFEHVLNKTAAWGTPNNLMFVTGATQTEHLEQIRRIVPEHFLLVPGVGAQGGDLNTVAQACMTPDVGLLINSSREILYASAGADFAEVAGQRAEGYQSAMSALLK